MDMVDIDMVYMDMVDMDMVDMGMVDMDMMYMDFVDMDVVYMELADMDMVDMDMVDMQSSIIGSDMPSALGLVLNTFRWQMIYYIMSDGTPEDVLAKIFRVFDVNRWIQKQTMFLI